MRILIVAGGTGGHIYPALALTTYLEKNYPTTHTLWVTGKRRLEQRILCGTGIDFKRINACSFYRKFSWRWIEFVWRTIVSLLQSFLIFLQFKPDVVVGMGSFHSYPVVIAAFFFRIPSLICEQNVFPSLTNRLLSKYASRIAISFPQTKDLLPSSAWRKIFLTGNPIRDSIITATKEEGLRELELKKDKFTLLFLGGSQGAHHLNQVAVETVKLLKKDGMGEKLQFIFITGECDWKFVSNSISKIEVSAKIFPFFPKIHYAYAATDLLISRSGATTIAEITVRGIPAILIPYPSATDEHQLRNAQILEKMGAARIISEDDITPQRLRDAIEELIVDKNLILKMGKKSKELGKKDATQEVAKIVHSLVALKNCNK